MDRGDLARGQDEALEFEDQADPRPELLQARAARLRRRARRLDPLVSVAFRRRACELELMAWAIENGPLSPVDDGATDDVDGVAV